VITTVIPTFRRPQLLQRAITSVLAQRHHAFQIKIFDNASGDETEQVVAAFQRAGHPIGYFKHATNLGLVDNIIFGIGQIETPYFSVLSDDDMLAPDFFSAALTAFARYPDASLCLTDSIRVDKRNRILTGPTQSELTGSIRYFGPGAGFIAAARGEIPAPWIGTMFRREVITAVGLPNPKAGPSINDNFVLRALARLPCAVCASLGCVVMENTESVGYSIGALSGEWPAWWIATADDIEQDKLVAEEVRAQARALLVPDFRKLAVRQVLQGLGRFGVADIAYARRAAQGAAECGFRYTAKALKSLIGMYERFDMIRSLVDRAALVRKTKSGIARDAAEKRYLPYVSFLTALSDAGQLK